DVDAALWIIEQVHDIGAGGGVNRYPFATRDVADDFFAANRTAAPRAEHHQIVEAADLDLLLAGAEHAPHAGGDHALPALLAHLVGGHEPHEDLLGLHLSVADRREQILGLADREVIQGFRELRTVDDGLWIQVVAARLLLEQLAPELLRPRFFLRMNQVLD